MGNTWGKITSTYNNYKKPNKLDQFDSTIFNLKLVRDKIKVSQASAINKEAQFKNMAKIYLKENDRDRAKLYLGKSKIFKVQLDTLNVTLFQVLEQIEMLETTKIQTSTMRVLQEGNSILKQCQLDIDKFKEIKEDMEDIKSQNLEVAEFLKGFSSNHDQEIEDELNLLMNPSKIDEPKVDLTKSKIFKEIVQNEEEEKKAKEWVLV